MRRMRAPWERVVKWMRAPLRRYQDNTRSGSSNGSCSGSDRTAVEEVEVRSDIRSDCIGSGGRSKLIAVTIF